MSFDATNPVEEVLTLRAQLGEISRVPAWLAGLSSRYGIPEETLFAMNVCLEEALANVVLHGYLDAANRTMSVRFIAPREAYFVVQVVDDAPPFNPLDSPALPALNPDEQMRVGGQGIRLLREFTQTLEYEQLANGNCLKMGFGAAQ